MGRKSCRSIKICKCRSGKLRKFHSKLKKCTYFHWLWLPTFIQNQQIWKSQYFFIFCPPVPHLYLFTAVSVCFFVVVVVGHYGRWHKKAVRPYLPIQFDNSQTLIKTYARHELRSTIRNNFNIMTNIYNKHLADRKYSRRNVNPPMERSMWTEKRLGDSLIFILNCIFQHFH